MTADYQGAAMTPLEQAPPASQPIPERRPGFSLGGVLAAIAALVVVAGIVAALVLFVFADTSSDVELVTPQPPSASSEPAVQEAEIALAGTSALKVSNAEVFTFRDIFVPLIEPLPEDTGSGGSGGSGGGSSTTTTPVDADDYLAGTLYLIDVVTEGGVQKAVMVWDKKKMTLGEGQSIAGTPWQVLDVRDSSVIMLYGDHQVTLTIGQGIVK